MKPPFMRGDVVVCRNRDGLPGERLEVGRLYFVWHVVWCSFLKKWLVGLAGTANPHHGLRVFDCDRFEFVASAADMLDQPAGEA